MAPAKRGQVEKLVATDTQQFIPGIGELVWQPAPSIQRMLHAPQGSCAHVRFFLSDRSPSAGFTSPGPPSTCLKPRNTEIPLSPKTLSRGTARARARAKSRFLDQPYNPRMLTQESVTRTNPGQSGAKPVKQPLALTSPTWVRGLSRALRESARPRGAENCEKQNSAFPQNLVKWLPTRARAWGKSDFSTTRTIRACKSNSTQAEARS